MRLQNTKGEGMTVSLWSFFSVFNEVEHAKDELRFPQQKVGMHIFFFFFFNLNVL